jgi:hypothetical protein
MDQKNRQPDSTMKKITNMQQIGGLPTQGILSSVFWVLAGLVWIFSEIPASGQQEGLGVPFTAELDQASEAVSVPTQLSPLFSAKIERVEADGKVLISSSAMNPCLALTNESRPAYLEVTGPAGHAWLGHRLDVGTGSRATGQAQLLQIISSPRNTRASLDPSLVSAEIRVHPHLSLPYLFEKESQWILNKFPECELRFFVPSESGFQEFRPQSDDSAPTISWNTFMPESDWTPATSQDLVIAPGECLVLRKSARTSVGFSILGILRTSLPCSRPWKGKGPHLLGYPFSADLRLGQDWPAADGPLKPSENAKDCDYLGLYLPNGYKTFGLFAETGRPSVWREILKPGTRRAAWGDAGNVLRIIPAGQGFLLYARKDGPDHFFFPPQP